MRQLLDVYALSSELYFVKLKMHGICVLDGVVVQGTHGTKPAGVIECSLLGSGIKLDFP
jgi:hypothetical protein